MSAEDLKTKFGAPLRSGRGLRIKGQEPVGCAILSGLSNPIWTEYTTRITGQFKGFGGDIKREVSD